jgi:gas vesicle protein
MGKTGKYAVGAAAAALAGYVAGILTAPKSGKETREDIKNTAFKTKREAENKLKALHKELDETITDARERAAKLSAKAKEEMSGAMNAAMAAKDRVREILSAIHEGDAEDKELDAAIKDATSALEHLKTYFRKDVTA